MTAPAALRSSCAPGASSVNYAPPDRHAPFGGYKQSGNGREWGRYGLEDFLEIKAIIGHNAS